MAPRGTPRRGFGGILDQLRAHFAENSVPPTRPTELPVYPGSQAADVAGGIAGIEAGSGTPQTYPGPLVRKAIEAARAAGVAPSNAGVTRGVLAGDSQPVPITRGVSPLAARVDALSPEGKMAAELLDELVELSSAKPLFSDPKYDTPSEARVRLDQLADTPTSRAALQKLLELTGTPSPGDVDFDMLKRNVEATVDSIVAQSQRSARTPSFADMTPEEREAFIASRQALPEEVISKPGGERAEIVTTEELPDRAPSVQAIPIPVRSGEVKLLPGLVVTPHGQKVAKPAGTWPAQTTLEFETMRIGPDGRPIWDMTSNGPELTELSKQRGGADGNRSDEVRMWVAPAADGTYQVWDGSVMRVMDAPTLQGVIEDMGLSRAAGPELPNPVAYATPPDPDVAGSALRQSFKPDDEEQVIPQNLQAAIADVDYLRSIGDGDGYRLAMVAAVNGDMERAASAMEILRNQQKAIAVLNLTQSELGASLASAPNGVEEAINHLSRHAPFANATREDISGWLKMQKAGLLAYANPDRRSAALVDEFNAKFARGEEMLAEARKAVAPQAAAPSGQQPYRGDPEKIAQRAALQDELDALEGSYTGSPGSKGYSGGVEDAPGVSYANNQLQPGEFDFESGVVRRRGVPEQQIPGDLSNQVGMANVDERVRDLRSRIARLDAEIQDSVINPPQLFAAGPGGAMYSSATDADAGQLMSRITGQASPGPGVTINTGPNGQAASDVVSASGPSSTGDTSRAPSESDWQRLIRLFTAKPTADADPNAFSFTTGDVQAAQQLDQAAGPVTRMSPDSITQPAPMPAGAMPFTTTPAGDATRAAGKESGLARRIREARDGRKIPTGGVDTVSGPTSSTADNAAASAGVEADAARLAYHARKEVEFDPDQWSASNHVRDAVLAEFPHFSRPEYATFLDGLAQSSAADLDSFARSRAAEAAALRISSKPIASGVSDTNLASGAADVRGEMPDMRTPEDKLADVEEALRTYQVTLRNLTQIKGPDDRVTRMYSDLVAKLQAQAVEMRASLAGPDAAERMAAQGTAAISRARGVLDEVGAQRKELDTLRRKFSVFSRSQSKDVAREFVTDQAIFGDRYAPDLVPPIYSIEGDPDFSLLSSAEQDLLRNGRPAEVREFMDGLSGTIERMSAEEPTWAAREKNARQIIGTSEDVRDTADKRLGALSAQGDAPLDDSARLANDIEASVNQDRLGDQMGFVDETKGELTNDPQERALFESNRQRLEDIEDQLNADDEVKGRPGGAKNGLPAEERARLEDERQSILSARRLSNPAGILDWAWSKLSGRYDVTGNGRVPIKGYDDAIQDIRNQLGDATEAGDEAAVSRLQQRLDEAIARKEELDRGDTKQVRNSVLQRRPQGLNAGADTRHYDEGVSESAIGRIEDTQREIAAAEAKLEEFRRAGRDPNGELSESDYNRAIFEQERAIATLRDAVKRDVRRFGRSKPRKSKSPAEARFKMIERLIDGQATDQEAIGLIDELFGDNVASGTENLLWLGRQLEEETGLSDGATRILMANLRTNPAAMQRADAATMRSTAAQYVKLIEDTRGQPGRQFPNKEAAEAAYAAEQAGPKPIVDDQPDTGPKSNTQVMASQLDLGPAIDAATAEQINPLATRLQQLRAVINKAAERTADLPGTDSIDAKMLNKMVDELQERLNRRARDIGYKGTEYVAPKKEDWSSPVALNKTDSPIDVTSRRASPPQEDTPYTLPNSEAIDARERSLLAYDRQVEQVQARLNDAQKSGRGDEIVSLQKELDDAIARRDAAEFSLDLDSNDLERLRRHVQDSVLNPNDPEIRSRLGEGWHETAKPAGRPQVTVTMNDDGTASVTVSQDFHANRTQNMGKLRVGATQQQADAIVQKIKQVRDNASLSPEDADAQVKALHEELNKLHYTGETQQFTHSRTETFPAVASSVTAEAHQNLINDVRTKRAAAERRLAELHDDYDSATDPSEATDIQIAIRGLEEDVARLKNQEAGLARGRLRGTTQNPYVVDWNDDGGFKVYDSRRTDGSKAFADEDAERAGREWDETYERERQRLLAERPARQQEQASARDESRAERMNEAGEDEAIRRASKLESDDRVSGRTNSVDKGSEAPPADPTGRPASRRADVDTPQRQVDADQKRVSAAERVRKAQGRSKKILGGMAVLAGGTALVGSGVGDSDVQAGDFGLGGGSAGDTKRGRGRDSAGDRVRKARVYPLLSTMNPNPY